jgi:hypothetical protein
MAVGRLRLAKHVLGKLHRRQGDLPRRWRRPRKPGNWNPPAAVNKVNVSPVSVAFRHQQWLVCEIAGHASHSQHAIPEWLLRLQLLFSFARTYCHEVL